MRAIFVIALALLVASCRPDLPKMAADRLSGTVLIVSLGSESKNKDGPSEDGGGMGTGFFVEDNLIVTNSHVVSGSLSVKILGYRDAKAYDAKVIASDKNADIAILKLNDWDQFKANVKPKILSWSSSRDLKVGDKVWSMGNPYGLSWTVAEGLVSHKLRQAKRDRSFYIQTTTQIYPGNSGGPLLDSKGDVIAINSAIVGKEGYFGMSIASDYAQKVVSDLKEYGKINKAKLGVKLADSDDEHGIKIMAIEQDSSGISAGLLPNDQIKGVKTKHTKGRFVDIFEAEELISEAMLLQPGDDVELLINRDSTLRTFKFTTKPVSEP